MKTMLLESPEQIAFNILNSIGMFDSSDDCKKEMLTITRIIREAINKELEAQKRIIQELSSACKEILNYHERGVEKNQPVLSNFYINTLKQAINKAEN
jgi:hypothetical protein